jgi:glycosyltransferase involved in cell wall biosynthesis
MLAWKIFMDKLSDDAKKKCAFVLHTQPVDENGTDLYAVKDMLFGNYEYNIIFEQNRYPTNIMNLLYNATDITALISSNEGWGLSLTEAMMCGKPIIATVTGGMQDHLLFEDENGEWIKFTEEFGSNHRGKYKKAGKWAYSVFPSNLSLVGSVPTPYIFDDRAEPFDIADQISRAYIDKMSDPKEWIEKGKAAREWVTSDESMMTARWMCKNTIDGIDATFEKWTPRHRFELIQIETRKQPKHFIKHVIAK